MGWVLKDFFVFKSPNSFAYRLAKIFKRPTTWGDYCKHVTNCTSDDGIAARSPVDESESGRYFVEGLYTGFFRDTEKNDCLLNPNCTGHVVDYPCSWKPFTEQQLFWNDIPLESDNSGEHYSGGSLKEIFYAANATKSDIMAVWWKPDPTFDQFDYIRVSFPFPSSDCIENRRPTVDRCTASHGELVGNKKGACDLGILPLEKFVATSLQENVFSTPIDTRSPSYQFISSFTFQNIQVEQLLQSWYSRNVDRYGYDPREAVCEYVAQNLGKSLYLLNEFFDCSPPRFCQVQLSYFSIYSNKIRQAHGFCPTWPPPSSWKNQRCELLRRPVANYIYRFWSSKRSDHAVNIWGHLLFS